MARITQSAKRTRLDTRQVGGLIDREKQRLRQPGLFRSNRRTSFLSHNRLHISDPVADVVQHIEHPLQPTQHFVLNLLIASPTTLVFIRHSTTLRNRCDTNPVGTRSQPLGIQSLARPPSPATQENVETQLQVLLDLRERDVLSIGAEPRSPSRSRCRQVPGSPCHHSRGTSQNARKRHSSRGLA